MNAQEHLRGWLGLGAATFPRGQATRAPVAPNGPDRGYGLACAPTAKVSGPERRRVFWLGRSIGLTAAGQRRTCTGLSPFEPDLSEGPSAAIRLRDTWYWMGPHRARASSRRCLRGRLSGAFSAASWSSSKCRRSSPRGGAGALEREPLTRSGAGPAREVGPHLVEQRNRVRFRLIGSRVASFNEHPAG